MFCLDEILAWLCGYPRLGCVVNLRLGHQATLSFGQVVFTIQSLPEHNCIRYYLAYHIRIPY